MKEKILILGDVFRDKREERNLLLRQVASELELDQAILSKIERSERRPTRQQLQSLIDFYDLDERMIYAEWNADRIIELLAEENDRQDILKRTIKKLKD